MSDSKSSPPFTDDDLITCGICHTEIEDPRSLLCLHTYCLRCLREWSKGKTDEVTCPMCREPTPLPPDGVDGLRKNFFVTNLKQSKALARQLADKDVKIVCTSCQAADRNAAVARCFECDDFLCSSCVKIHKSVRVLQDHKVLTLEELKSGNVKLSDPKKQCCSEHISQILWFYCNTCNVPICRDCTVVDHPATSHDLVKLRDAIAGQREEIKTLAKGGGNLQMSIKTSLQTVEASMEALDQSCRKASAAVTNAKDEAVLMVTKEIQKAYQDHMIQISTLKSEKGKNLMERKEKLQMLECRLNSALRMANEVVEGGSDSDIASVYAQLTSTFKQLQQVPTKPGIPKSMSICEFRRKDLKLGELQLGSVHGGNSNSFSTNNWNLIREFGKTGGGKLKNAKGLAIARQGRVAVADYNASKVYIYNYGDGCCIQAIDTTKSLFSNPKSYKSYPFTVAVFEDGNYLIGDWTKYPTVYNSTGSYIKQIKPSYATCDKNPLTKGVAIDKYGKVYMGCANVKQKLDIFNDSVGTLQSTMDVSLYPQYISISTDDHIIISADSRDGAQVINSEGQLIHTLCPPIDVTSSWCPAGVCTIGEGDEEEIFICNPEGKGGVYRFLLKIGKYLGRITADLQCPQSVAYADEDKLLIVTEECSVKVFAPVAVE